MNNYSKAIEILEMLISDKKEDQIKILFDIAKRSPSEIVKAYGNTSMDCQIKKEYKENGKISAIKMYRNFFNKTLKESKEAVEKLCE